MRFYHVNDDGNVLPCTSPDNCPFGAYVTEQEARDAYDEKMSINALTSHKKEQVYEDSKDVDHHRMLLSLALENNDIKLIKFFSKHSDFGIRGNVAMNKNTPASILSQLADDDSIYVRSNVAENRNTPVRVLSQLAEDNNHSVRASVAENESAPIQVLSQLAKDDDPEVRSSVAYNKNTPIALMNELAKDKNYYVRAHIASNKNVPKDIVKKLFKDRSILVRIASARRLDGSEIAPLVSEVKDGKFLKFLSKNSSEDVRVSVAKNENTPAPVLKELANDDSIYVRMGVAENKNNPF